MLCIGAIEGTWIFPPKIFTSTPRKYGLESLRKTPMEGTPPDSVGS